MNRDTDERSTPQELFDELDSEFHFTLDVAATAENTKCKRFFNKERNGLFQSWRDNVCFMNPPYSNIYAWLSKAALENFGGHCTVVCILPCDSSTKWFHDFLWDKFNHKPRLRIQLRFPKGRYKFGRYTTSPQFATIIAVLR